MQEKAFAFHEGHRTSAFVVVFVSSLRERIPDLSFDVPAQRSLSTTQEALPEHHPITPQCRDPDTALTSRLISSHRISCTGVPAAAPAHSPLLSLLEQTPALLHACTSLDASTTSMRARSQNAGPLKLLRRVSRGARAVASRAVTVLELPLNRQPGRDMTRWVQLLEGASLQCFGVEVRNSVLTRGKGERAVAEAGEHLLQQCFSFQSS